MTYNTNGPNGLQPLYSGGNGVSGVETEYQIAATGGQTMFEGDLVSLGTTGQVIRATASTSALGTFKGAKWLDTSGNWQFTNFWAGATAVNAAFQTVAIVNDDSQQIYTIQETDAGSASGTPLTQAAVGNTINILYTAGSTRTGISAVSMNNASSATTLVGNLIIVGLDPRVGNAVGAFANWLVRVNNGVYKAGSTRP